MSQTALTNVKLDAYEGQGLIFTEKSVSGSSAVYFFDQTMSGQFYAQIVSPVKDRSHKGDQSKSDTPIYMGHKDLSEGRKLTAFQIGNCNTHFSYENGPSSCYVTIFNRDPDQRDNTKSMLEAMLFTAE